MKRVLTTILIVFFILLVNTASAQDKFRVSPTVSLRPVEEVIDRYQDGIVELYMVNPVLNDATLSVVLVVTAPPSGIHVYGGDLEPGTIDEKNLVGIYEVPPGTARTVEIGIKADRFARIGYNTLFFYASYSPKYADQSSSESVSLTYGVNVMEASDEYQIAVKPTPISTPTDDILNFKIISESNNELVFTVDYAYNSNHGDNVWLGATALQGTNEFLWFSYRPAKAKRGEGTATITLGYDANNPPPSVSTNQIKVDMYVGGGDAFYSKNFDYVKTWYAQAPAPTPTYTPEQRDSTSGIIGVVFILIVISGIVLAFKAAKRRPTTPAIEPAPMRHAPAQYPAVPKPQEPVAKPQANELKELKEKLSKTNQLLDKLDERLVNGELTEAKYKELAGKYKSEADSIKNLISEKELLSEVGLRDE